MTEQRTEIRRNADGSIDTNYYVAHCHHMRSLAAHRAIGRLFAALKTIFAPRRGIAGVTCEKARMQQPTGKVAAADHSVRISKAA